MNKLAKDYEQYLEEFDTLLSNLYEQAQTYSKKKKIKSLQKNSLTIVSRLFLYLNLGKESYSNIFSENFYPDGKFNNYITFKKFLINSLFGNDIRTKKVDFYENKKKTEEVCQYCFYKDVNALDHFIEKDKSPELSILPMNLVPVCTSCNSKKNSPENGPFIYPYYSILDILELVKCKITIQKKKGKQVTSINFFIDKQFDKEKEPLEFNLVKKFDQQLKQRETYDNFLARGVYTSNYIIEHFVDLKIDDSIPEKQKLYRAKIFVQRFLCHTCPKRSSFKYIICNYILNDLNNENNIWNSINPEKNNAINIFQKKESFLIDHTEEFNKIKSIVNQFEWDSQSNCWKTNEYKQLNQLLANIFKHP